MCVSSFILNVHFGARPALLLSVHLCFFLSLGRHYYTLPFYTDLRPNSQLNDFDCLSLLKTIIKRQMLHGNQCDWGDSTFNPTSEGGSCPAEAEEELSEFLSAPWWSEDATAGLMSGGGG